MKYLITGHRLFKLQCYDIEWIKLTLEEIIHEERGELTYGLSGMASGVDLWFCNILSFKYIPWAACIPFDEQENEMGEEEQVLRRSLLESMWCDKVYKIRNSQMLEKADRAIVVWDGNKGGTHNVVQQLIEKNKPFIWINPVGEKVWRCF